MVHKTRVLSWGIPALKPIRLLFIVTCLLFFQSCLTKPDSVLRVATNVWPGYETLYLARSLGFYDRSSIRLVEMTSASQVSHAIRNGTVEAAALTLDEALSLMQDHNVDLRVVLVMDISNGADVLMVRSNIVNLKDLKGKAIGVENNATGAIVLDAVLQNAGLRANDVQVVPLTVNDHLSAWKNSKIDALVTFEPIRSALIPLDAHELFDSSQILGRILDVLVVRADALLEHELAIKTLIAGHFAALNHIAQNPSDAAKRMAGRLATNSEQVLPQFEGLKQPDLAENWRWLSGAEPALNDSANALVKLMLQHQLLRHEVKIGTLASAEFLPEITK